MGEAKGHRSDAGLEKAELRQIASVERKLDGITRGNNVAERGTDIDRRRVRSHIDQISARLQLERYGEVHGPVDVYADACCGEIREAGSGHMQVVFTHGQIRKMEVAAL